MKRKIITTSAFWVAIAALTFVVLPYVYHWGMTGRWLPIRIAERLKSPIAVDTWSEQGLLLADGRSVQLPGFHKLPKTSIALREATKRGIEIDSNGRVFGLCRVHHWCGNDPIREHVARVDLAHMLIFLREAELTVPLGDGDKELLYSVKEAWFSDIGWEAGQFALFNGWSKYDGPTNAGAGEPSVRQGNSASSQ